MAKNDQKQRKASPLQKIAILLCGLFLVLVTLEIGLRVGGFLMLSMQEYKNLQSIKQKGEFRIMCLGESTTQGQYPPYLEEILNKHNLGVKVSVIDKGLATTNTLAILLQLEANLDRYQPDMVVTMMGCNDWMTLYYQDIPDSGTWAFKHCRVYRFSRILFANFFKKLKKEDIYSVNKSAPALKAPYPQQNEPRESERPSNKAEPRPGKDSAWVRSGRLYSAQGKLAESEQAFRKAQELNPKNDSAYVELGYVYKDQGKYPEAELVFKKAIELNPQNDSAYAGIGWLYKDQGRYAEAESMVKKAMRINPQNDFAYAELGRLYISQKRYVESEQMLKEAIRLNPKQGVAYEVLSVVYKDQGKFTEAEQILHRAVELNPEYAPAYVELGQVYKMQKRLAEAEKAFSKAIELNPRNVLAHGGLATVYGETGKDGLSKAHADKLNNLRGECYNPVTANNYHKLKRILDKRRVMLVCVQYPMRSLQPLKNIFPGENVIFVDNEKTFKDAVKREGYNEYFRDMFGGDFGHCTAKGNRLLAENIAGVIVKEIFDQ